MNTHTLPVRGTVEASDRLLNPSACLLNSDISAWVTPPLKVAVVDVRALFGEILVLGLKTADPATHFTYYRSLSDWLTLREATNEAVVLLSIDIKALESDTDGCLQMLSDLKEEASPTQFIVASSAEDPEIVLRTLEAGACSYISTSMRLSAVIRVIHLVHAGGTFIPTTSLQMLAARPNLDGRQAPPQEMLLSPRQMMVAKALRKGTPNKLIAYDLNMCESTVKVHVRQIMKKLKARNRTQIAYLTNAMFDEDE